MTGVLVASTEFFGEEEARREATRDLTSPISTSSPPNAWSESIARAMASAQQRAPGAPIDKVTAMFWAIALAVLTISRLVIYWTMRHRNPVGLQKVSW